MTWVLDLDGVIWRGPHPVPGASDAVARLQAAGESVWFVTNNALPLASEVAAKLEAQGIEVGARLLTSPMAAARLVRPGERVLACAGPGVVEALLARGAEVIDAGDPHAGEQGSFDAVVVGLHRDFDYARLVVAADAARSGARLIATNDDTTYPAAGGRLQPGAGSILAAVQAASGAVAVVAGKPYPPMVELVREQAGPTGMAVGDRADTDGRFARALGYRFGLVLTGVTGVGDLPVDPTPDQVAPDLGALVDRALADAAPA
jgi:HAD superfamily hydrolase (TIGR01450 family)